MMDTLSSTIQSSLVLAVLLNLSFSLFVAYSIISFLFLLDKVNNFSYKSDIQHDVIVPFYVIWFVVEVIRLQLGEKGNCEESVSKLAASMLLTVFPQIPVSIYFGYYQEIIFPADTLFASVLINLLIIQVVVSFLTLRRLIRDKTRRFYRFCIQEAEEAKKLKDQKEAEVAYWSKYAVDEQIS